MAKQKHKPPWIHKQIEDLKFALTTFGWFSLRRIATSDLTTFWSTCKTINKSGLCNEEISTQAT